MSKKCRNVEIKTGSVHYTGQMHRNTESHLIQGTEENASQEEATFALSQES